MRLTLANSSELESCPAAALCVSASAPALIRGALAGQWTGFKVRFVSNANKIYKVLSHASEIDIRCLFALPTVYWTDTRERLCVASRARGS